MVNEPTHRGERVGGYWGKARALARRAAKKKAAQSATLTAVLCVAENDQSIYDWES
jgi:hypothetical protein